MKPHTNKVTRTERGWPGHFICASRCVFHRNTLLSTGEQSIVVSTIGRMIDYHAPGFPATETYDEIGHERYGETMVFEGEDNGAYTDANVSRRIFFESPWRDTRPIDELTDLFLNDMHETVVDEITDRLEIHGYIEPCLTLT